VQEAISAGVFTVRSGNDDLGNSIESRAEQSGWLLTVEVGLYVIRQILFEASVRTRGSE